MKVKMLKLHSKLILMFAVIVAISLAIPLGVGESKPKMEVEPLDILGEGGVVFITLIWIYASLISRPAGRVTDWLIVGLTCLHVSVLLDFLDEFYRYPDEFSWLTTIESLPAPLGMILMSLGLYLWHKEQLTINDQLLGKERFYRQHDFTDSITNLYSAEYMVEQISAELAAEKSCFSLLLLDIDHFDIFIRRHGDEQGDRLLRVVAELILMNLRTSDLACRYAGDRFIVLMPDTPQIEAQKIVEQINQAITHLAFKPDKTTDGNYHTLSISICESTGWHTTDSLLSDLNQKLDAIKQVRNNPKAA